MGEKAINSRLIIQKLSLNNFKSYGGTVELGPFHKKFCCVVGPNGSGKSNVIDALLFVFGFRAAKIRLKKLSMLIHNSDETASKIESCSVSVHFANIIDSPNDPDYYQVVEGSEFVISRSAFRDNSSTYYINSRRSNFKEVTDLLKSKDVDLDHNRFLILQGEVEQIAQMKPKGVTEHDEGLLEYMEDIIGTFKYKDQITSVGVELGNLEELRKDQMKRVALVENEKNELQKSKNEAVAFLELENKITLTKNSLMQKYKFEVSESLKQLEVEYNEVKSELDAKLTSQKEIEKQMTCVKTSKDSKCRELKAVNDKIEDLHRQFAEIDQKDVKQRSDIKNAKEQVPKLEKTIENLKKKIAETVNIPSEKAAELERLEEDLQNLEELKVKLDEEYSTAVHKVDTKQLQQQKEEKNKILITKDEITSKCRRELGKAQTDLEILNKNRDRLGEQLKQAQEGYEKVEADLREKTEQLSSLPKEVEKLTSTVSESKLKMNKLAQSETELYSQLQTVRSDLENGRRTIKQNQSRGRQLDALMKERELGNIPGIIGRLGDLGSISERFDVAISTACPQLDYIVVDNMDTAKACVQLLKQRNLGLASFLGLDKMQVHLRNSQKPIQVPRGTVRLFDQIEIKNAEHAGAFYFALRDTLVAETIEEARRVALHGSQRWRVVTLNGELVELSGTMSGGGSRVARGLMSNKTTAEEFTPLQINEMEKREKDLKEKLERCLQEKADVESQLETDQHSLREKQNALKQMDQRIKLLKDQMSSYKVRIGITEKELKAAEPDPEETKKMTAVIEKLTKDYEAAAQISDKLKQQVSELNQKILDVANEVLGPIKKRQNKCQQDRQNVSAEINRAKAAIKSAEKNLKKMQTQLEQDEQEVVRLVEMKKNLKTLLVESEKKAAAVLQQIEVCEKEQNEQEAAIKEFNAELSKYQKEIDEFKQSTLAIQHQCDQLSAKIKDKNSQINNYTKQISAQTLNIDHCAPCELATLTDEAISELDVNDLKQELESTEATLKTMKPNLASIVAFKNKYAQYMEKVDELDKLTTERNEKKKDLASLKTRRQTEFMTGLSIIVKKLKTMYEMITLGGDAELELVDSLDPFSEGVVFSVRPPKKSWKNISNLSGGEKTLSSLALVFALHHYKPTPFYFMDEIDAALDFKNVSIIANYIQERTTDAQFIIISLRSQMFELSDQLVGIYKTNNSTKSVSMFPRAVLAETAEPRRRETNAPSGTDLQHKNYNEEPMEQ